MHQLNYISEGSARTRTDLAKGKGSRSSPHKLNEHFNVE
jgi:hypothetical protein